MERKRKNITVADLNSMSIVPAKIMDAEEDEEEEFVKYGAVDEFYDLDKEIGKGAYGVVKKCIHKENGTIFAAKIIKTANHKIRKSVMREIEVMRALGKHSKLVELWDAYQTPFEIVMVLEFVPGGELFERIVAEDYLMEDDAVDYVKQILEALKFMHERNFVHLDLKPENILCVSMDSNDIKLVDFGLARDLDSDQETKSSFGTPDFVAPEVIRMKPVSPASDLWSLGVVTYVLLSGLMPFSGEDDHQTLVKVAKADWDFDDECFDDLSHDAMGFIEGLLVKKPSQRFTIKECFQHPWIKDTKETGTKINTQKHKAFLAKRRWKKSVNALLAVRRMSLSPLFAGKRRSSMDPSILKSTAESEEDQMADRKVSAPVDPVGLSIPNHRHAGIRSSCFDLDANTIRALQEKADKAKERVPPGRDKENSDEISSEEDYEDDGSENEEGCSDGQVIEDDYNTASCSYDRPKANTICGATPVREMASNHHRKSSATLISFEDTSKNYFKSVSLTLNEEETQKNNEPTNDNNVQLNETDLGDCRMEKNGRDPVKDIREVSLEQSQNCMFDPMELTFRLDNINDSHCIDNDGERLPEICINDQLIVTSPPSVASTQNNNNIEKMDKNALEAAHVLQISPSLNIDNVTKAPSDEVQSISLKLNHLNGVQLTSDHLTHCVRRSSTGSAPC
ncbi:death-associated protein kinase 1-like isoform X1 [Montipora foliosa]|uniref:death-associated protein kinase 1-like isoform X1 n=2 Tax=Montipora foliosa TaxID=591990 RepID=UPI0035F178CD